MSKRLVLLSLLAVALLAGGLYGLFSRQPEPRYQGRPLSSWLAEYDDMAARNAVLVGPLATPHPDSQVNSSNRPPHEAAAEALRNIAPEALTNAAPR